MVVPPPSNKSVAHASCQLASNENTFRGEGIFTFVSDFGDQVGPFTEYTDADTVRVIC
jgi:hypothetical protein